MLAAFEKYRTILDNLYDGVYFVDFERKINYWNKSAERITGFSAAEVEETFCFDNILKHVDQSGNNLCKDFCPLSATIRDGEVREINVFLHHKEGYRVPVYVRSIPVKEDDGRIVGAVEIFTDSVDREKILERIKSLEKLAMLDQLTALPNRRYLENMLEISMNQQKSIGRKFGVIFIDIDNFKKFNDSYGHDIGDLVLINVSKTILLNLRSEDIIGRWGGEEFLGVIFADNNESLLRVAEKILALIRKTEINYKNEILSVTASMGVSLVKNTDTVDILVQRADDLMYKSKSSGKDKVTIG